jgi:hypothetical protein
LGGMPVDPIGLEKDSSRAFSRNTVWVDCADRIPTTFKGTLTGRGGARKHWRQELVKRFGWRAWKRIRDVEVGLVVRGIRQVSNRVVGCFERPVRVTGFPAGRSRKTPLPVHPTMVRLARFRPSRPDDKQLRGLVGI